MSTTKHRPAPSPMTRSPSTTPVSGRRLRMLGLLMVSMVVAAVVGVMWSLNWLGSSGDDLSAQMPGGEIEVLGVEPEIMVHPEGMPASMMPEPLPAGMVRYSVAVSIAAEDDAVVEYAARRIRLTAPGVEPAAPIRQTVGEGTLPAGARITGALVYEVPEDLRGATLTVPGSAGIEVTLPRGGGHHVDEVPGAPGEQGGIQRQVRPGSGADPDADRGADRGARR